MELSIHNLFPIPVGFFNLGRPITDGEEMDLTGLKLEA